MITLLGSLLGFGTSFMPEVLNFFRAGQDHKHSLERMKLEMDLMARRNELKLFVCGDNIVLVWWPCCI